MKKHYLPLLLIGGLCFTLTACGGDGDNSGDTPAPADTIDAAADDSEQEMLGFTSMTGNTYTVPSPNELFTIIKNSDIPYQDGLVSTESQKYSSSKDQALNFGRLTADIAYTASYEKFQESITNFDNLRKVGDDLGISYVFDEFMVSRVKSNMDNVDSLEIISSDSYQRIIAQLEEGEKGSTLAIIAAGGFVESIYLLSHMIGEYSEDDILTQRLADQKLVMENVLDYLHLFSDEPRVQEVLMELEGISDVFLKLDEVSVSPQKTESEDHRTVLGGSKVIITADEFQELKDAATNYRNSFSNANQG